MFKFDQVDDRSKNIGFYLYIFWPLAVASAGGVLI